jgi:hypothetical protein
MNGRMMRSEYWDYSRLNNSTSLPSGVKVLDRNRHVVRRQSGQRCRLRIVGRAPLG